MKVGPATGGFVSTASDRSARIKRGVFGTIVFVVFFYGYFLVQDLAVPATTHESSWDAMIPFWPWMVVIYLVFIPYIVAAAFTTPADRFPVIVLAAIVAAVCGWICFLAMPVSLARPDLASLDPRLRWVFGLVRAIDDSHNTFPSLHVAITWIGLAAFWSGRFHWLAVGAAVAISLSTLLVKQHAIIDVIGGMLLHNLLTLLGKTEHSGI